MQDPAALAVSEAAPIAERFAILAPSLTIRSSDDYVFAGQILDEVKGRWKDLEARRVEITGPMNAALKSANDLFRTPLEALKKAETVVKAEIARYSAAAEAARVRAMVERTGPVEAPPEAKGVSVRTIRKFRVVDEAAVPRHLCSPDLRKIAALPTDTEIPGVEWYTDSIVTKR